MSGRSVESRGKKEENTEAGYTFLSVSERLMIFLDGYPGFSKVWLDAELDTTVDVVYYKS